MVERPFQWAVLRNRNMRVTIGDREPQYGDDENIITGKILSIMMIKRGFIRNLRYFNI